MEKQVTIKLILSTRFLYNHAKEQDQVIQRFSPLAVSRGKCREIRAQFLLTFNGGLVPISTQAFEKCFLQIIYQMVLNQF